MQKLSEAWATIKNQWPDIEELPALKIDKKLGEYSGYQAGFSKKDYNAAMSAQGVQRYACSYNFAYFTRREPAVRGIPRNLSSVKRLMERTFTSPITFPEPLIVPVVDANFDPESQTELPTINADEIRDAYILAIARDIKLSHNPKDDER